MEKLIATESNWGATQNLRENSYMIIAICERKRKEMNKKFGLLNHKVQYISNTFSFDVIHFERNVEIYRLIFHFFPRLVAQILSILPEKFWHAYAKCYCKSKWVTCKLHKKILKTCNRFAVRVLSSLKHLAAPRVLNCWITCFFRCCYHQNTRSYSLAKTYVKQTQYEVWVHFVTLLRISVLTGNFKLQKKTKMCNQSNPFIFHKCKHSVILLLLF